MTTAVDGLPFPDFASSLAATDRASLVGLSFAEVRAWAVAKADEYQAFVYALLALHNSIAPIHRLPFEILSKIFEGCWKNRQSLRIAHVCRLWRSIVLQTTAFWSEALARVRFQQDSPPARYLLGFALDHSAPRDVKIFLAGFTYDSRPLLKPHIKRIVSLNVTISESYHLVDLWTCLNTLGMPELRSLTVALEKVRDDYKDIWYQLHSLQPSTLPRLDRLNIPGDLLSLAILPSLRHLTLTHQMHRGSYIYNQIGFFGDFCRMMERIPALETLKLIHAAFASSTAYNILSLPALRSFSVEHSPAGADCSFLLCHIELPEATRITYSDWFLGGQGIRAIAHPQSGPIHSILQKTTRLHMEFASWNSWVACYVGDVEMLHIDYCPEDRGATLSDVEGLVRAFRDRAPVTDLVMTIHHKPLIDLIDFRAFPQLRRLEINSFIAEAVLARLLALDDDGTLVCPHLEEIVLKLPFLCSDAMRTALLGPDKPVVADYIRLIRPIVHLVRVLHRRTQKGSHVKRVEFGFEEHPLMSRKSLRRLDLSSFEEEHRAVAFGALGALVHGPVVFRGFRFYPTSGYHLEAVWESDEDEDEDEEDGEPDIYNANESSKSAAPHLAAVLGVYDWDKNEDLGEGDEGQD